MSILAKALPFDQTGPNISTDERPNIIVLLADDLSYRAVSFSDNPLPQVTTPQLDLLAKDGVIFDRAYDTTAICMASRAQVFTGKYEFKTGTNFQHGAMATDIWQDSYQVQLREHGYFTGFVGKFGFAVRANVKNSQYNKREDLPVEDFDVWYGWPSQGKYNSEANSSIHEFSEEHPHTTAAVAAAANAFIDSATQQSKPFLLSVSFKAPHKPFIPDPAFNHIYKDTVWSKPSNYGESGANHLPQQAKSGRQYRTMLDFVEHNYQQNMRDYHQLVYGIDVAVAKIRQQLELQGLADNTVILFLSDNGYSLGAHNMSGKVLPYEEPSRTPMIVYDPRIQITTKIDRTPALVSNLDIAPTLFSLANIVPSEQIDGRSLIPLLTDKNATINDAIMLIQDWGNGPTHSLSVVTEDYKYIYWPYAHDMPVTEELYQLSNDNLEMNNLAAKAEYRSQLRIMQLQYDAAVKKWRNESVQTGNYPHYATLFTRNLSWQQKMASIPDKMKRQYIDWQLIEHESLIAKSKKNKKRKKSPKTIDSNKRQQ